MAFVAELGFIRMTFQAGVGKAGHVLSAVYLIDMLTIPDNRIPPII